MENETPLVSIVMAAFNEERYLHESIKSILDQTYTNFEFIIINDGSTDQSENIILSYTDKRIVYVKNEKNLKLIDSLNKGLKLAKGKYITRMDADDISMNNRLEKQVAFMEATPEIGISGAQLTIFGNSTGTMQFPLNHEEIQLYLLITSCFGNNVVIFRKSIMDQYQLFFEKGYLHSEDYKSWTKWTMLSKSANLSESLVKYRTHSNSVSIQYKSVQKETRDRIRSEYLAELFQLGADSKIAKDFTGPICFQRIKAIQHIIKCNKQSNLFPKDKLINTIIKLWYLDCLERVNKDSLLLFKYSLILKFELKNNLRNWLNLFKHFIKGEQK